MIKIFSFLLFLSIGCFWVLFPEEFVTLTALGYRIDISLWGLVTVIFFGGWSLHALLVLGKRIGFFREKKRLQRLIQKHEESQTFLLQGLTAVASKDVDGAKKIIKKLEALTPGAPLTLMLGAQTHVLGQDVENVEATLQKMASHPSTMVLGVRGLVQQYMGRQDWTKARHFTQRLLEFFPRNQWANETSLDIAIQSQSWGEALNFLKKMISIKVVSKESGSRQEALYLFLLGQQTARVNPEKALVYFEMSYQKNLSFVPNTTAYVLALREKEQWRKAKKALERAWSHSPHIDLYRLYVHQDLCRDVQQAADGIDCYKKTKYLASLSPKDKDWVTHFCLGDAAFQAELWGIAKEHLLLAWQKHPIFSIHRMLIVLAREFPGEIHLETLGQPQPDPSWGCEKCGHLHSLWLPSCSQCGLFDTFEWCFPSPGLSLLA